MRWLSRLMPNGQSDHGASPVASQAEAGRGSAHPGAPDAQTTVVFLHIPKTAGQTIHSELVRVMGETVVSPVRVHTQAATGDAQLPPGFQLYSGHLDWDALETLPEPRFVFTVLRDPLERIASFYFYLRRQAQGLDPAELKSPARFSMRRALEESADEYFFGGKPGWQKFVLDHYHSTYCTYLITRKMRGYREIEDLALDDLVDRAETAARGLDGVYSVDGLDALERDLKARLDVTVDLTGRFVNADPANRSEPRWPRLEAALEREESVAMLRRFALPDQMLMHRLGLGPAPDPID